MRKNALKSIEKKGQATAHRNYKATSPTASKFSTPSKLLVLEIEAERKRLTPAVIASGWDAVMENGVRWILWEQQGRPMLTATKPKLYAVDVQPLKTRETVLAYRAGKVS